MATNNVVSAVMEKLPENIHGDSRHMRSTLTRAFDDSATQQKELHSINERLLQGKMPTRAGLRRLDTANDRLGGNDFIRYMHDDGVQAKLVIDTITNDKLEHQRGFFGRVRDAVTHTASWFKSWITGLFTRIRGCLNTPWCGALMAVTVFSIACISMTAGTCSNVIMPFWNMVTAAFGSVVSAMESIWGLLTGTNTEPLLYTTRKTVELLQSKANISAYANCTTSFAQNASGTDFGNPWSMIVLAGMSVVSCGTGLMGNSVVLDQIKLDHIVSERAWIKAMLSMVAVSGVGEVARRAFARATSTEVVNGVEGVVNVFSKVGDEALRLQSMVLNSKRAVIHASENYVQKEITAYQRNNLAPNGSQLNTTNVSKNNTTKVSKKNTTKVSKKNIMKVSKNFKLVPSLAAAPSHTNRYTSSRSRFA